ncbi:3631_t:CDS:2 [Entrophospora sp. SA101]|nr:3631_t:CDS:2 [Entrophospora sp. SA101]
MNTGIKKNDPTPMKNPSAKKIPVPVTNTTILVVIKRKINKIVKVSLIVSSVVSIILEPVEAITPIANPDAPEIASFPCL